MVKKDNNFSLTKKQLFEKIKDEKLAIIGDKKLNKKEQMKIIAKLDKKYKKEIKEVENQPIIEKERDVDALRKDIKSGVPISTDLKSVEDIIKDASKTDRKWSRAFSIKPAILKSRRISNDKPEVKNQINEPNNLK